MTPEQTLINFVNSHPVQATLVAKAVWDAIIGALPAPTKDSTVYYVFVFKLMNGLAFNFQRARNTSIENSPNFVPAVEQYISRMSPPEIARVRSGASAQFE
jgi:hypothetical protein